MVRRRYAGQEVHIRAWVVDATVDKLEEDRRQMQVVHNLPWECQSVV